MQYPVNELFCTIQGEGHHTGRPSVFLRLQGCPVGCAWCDTQHTWNLDPGALVAPEATLESKGDPRWAHWVLPALVDAIQSVARGARTLVITGGEPCLYDLRPLTEAMAALGWQCQVETSGCYEVQVSAATWVTVSPKVAMKGGLVVRNDALVRANEIKHPVAMGKHIEQLDSLLADVPDLSDKIIALQPISAGARATELCLEVCMERNWHLSIQTHKLALFD